MLISHMRHIPRKHESKYSGQKAKQMIRFGWSHLLPFIMTGEPRRPKISDRRVLISDLHLPSQVGQTSLVNAIPRCLGHVLYCYEHMEPSSSDTLAWSGRTLYGSRVYFLLDWGIFKQQGRASQRFPKSYLKFFFSMTTACQ